MTQRAATQAIDELLVAVHSYFDALYNGDTDLFAKVMHSRVRLFSATDEPMIEMDLPAYVELVRNRPSPASRKDPRHDRILSIEIASPTTAHVRVQDAVLPKLFTDDLTFLRVEGEWKIVSKVWHYVLLTA
jgi:putative lumazine-binding protein